MTELTHDVARSRAPERTTPTATQPTPLLPAPLAHEPAAPDHDAASHGEAHAAGAFDRLRRHGDRTVRRMMNDDDAGPVADGFVGPGDALPDKPDVGTPAYLLAYDPAVKKYRQSEYETAVRIITERQVRLRRAEEGARHDWVDDHGTTYDAVGNFPATFFEKQWPTLQKQIRLHLGKAQVVPVDVAQFSEDQRALVRAFVVDLANAQVVIVGDK
ncbi:hypothetical protein [Cellulomonas persica]|uniref:CdiA C-terminal tRNase domain-containing protein n=1 Tax=Cellulomonas persica TaxID=76861 RepID=A0A510UX52_9CELL|nr:hypothetical protein [Cellulomonas persica]GEK19238.1 hypothetical protein CPE01_29710 [Cellulomonas persica]